jgi:hypothetical protein
LYGGGGVPYAFANDFVELHNISDAGVEMASYSIQYASGSATSAQSSWNKVNLPDVVIPSGGFFLVQFGQNPDAGTALPSPWVLAGICLLTKGS